MTIETTLTVAKFLGNGVTRKFPLPFPLLAASHLEVYVTPQGMKATYGAEPLTGGYSVQDMDTAEPYVVFPEDPFASPLGVGEQLVVMRRLPLIQQTNLENGGNLHAETLEMQFDLMTMQLQQVDYDLQRCIKVPPYFESNTMDTAQLLRQMEALCERAEAAAKRLEEREAMETIDDGVKNMAATWVSKAIEAGSVVDLPVFYLPHANMLSISVDGVVCYPKNTGAMDISDIYQFEEIAEEEGLSQKIRFLFPIAEGSVCHATVLAKTVLPPATKLIEKAHAVAEHLEHLLQQAEMLTPRLH